MVKLHPNYINKAGKREFVILPYEEFSLIKELMEDFEDLRDLRAAKKAEGGKRGIPLEKVKAQLGIA